MMKEEKHTRSYAQWRAEYDTWHQRDRQRLTTAPQLTIGDGALGFWKALVQAYPTTRHQHCWMRRTGNILKNLLKKGQAKSALQAIWMAATRADTETAFDAFFAAYRDKYPKAVDYLAKDRAPLLTFYGFPDAHWLSLCTTNPIESTVTTARLRTDKTRGSVSRNTNLSLTFKRGQTLASTPKLSVARAT